MGRFRKEAKGQPGGNAQGPLGPHKKPFQTQAPLLDQTPQVVSGHIAPDRWIGGFDGFLAALVHSVKPTRIFRKRFDRSFLHLRQPQYFSACQNQVGIHHVIGHVAVFDRMGAAGIGAEHPAEGRHIPRWKGPAGKRDLYP